LSFETRNESQTYSQLCEVFNKDAFFDELIFVFNMLIISILTTN